VVANLIFASGFYRENYIYEKVVDVNSRGRGSANSFPQMLFAQDGNREGRVKVCTLL
jgi:hypothetical protein